MNNSKQMYIFSTVAADAWISDEYFGNFQQNG